MRSTCSIFLIIIVAQSPKDVANIYSVFVLYKENQDKQNRGDFYFEMSCLDLALSFALLTGPF